MRLLSKNEIDRRKASDRQREISEGLKIAKRVDNLRSMLPQEEAAFEKYRKETLENIQAEILLNSNKVDELKNEVGRLEKRKEDALKPITELWNRVNAEKSEVEAKNRALESSVSALETEKLLIASKHRVVEEEGRKTQELKQIAGKEATEANQAKEQAQQKLQEAVKVKDKSEREAKKIEQELSRRKEEIEKRECTIFENEKKIVQEYEEIENEKIRLADMRATLERAFSRLKK